MIAEHLVQPVKSSTEQQTRVSAVVAGEPVNAANVGRT